MRHHAPAVSDAKLEQVCLRARAGSTEEELGELRVTLADYPRGLSIWGTVPPVYDSTYLPSSRGLHLHIANEQDQHQELSCGELYVRTDSVSEYEHFTWEAAYAYVASTVFQRDLITVDCPNCKLPHLDIDLWSVHTHRNHHCTNCSARFLTPSACISNPLIRAKAALGDKHIARVSQETERYLRLSQQDYPGGIRLWGSNPAIIWTFSNLEKIGIHVHCFGNDLATPVIDQTVRDLEIDGITVESQMVRTFMAQQTLPYLLPHLTDLHCPTCGAAHFDIGENALIPHLRHTCFSCGESFLAPEPPYLCVSNPLTGIMKNLFANAESRKIT